MNATQSNYSSPTASSRPRTPVPGGAFGRDIMSSGLAGEISDLLSGARCGDRQCIGDLLSQYRNYLMLLATTQLEKPLRRRVSPSDIVQETMLRAHRHFGQFRGRTEQELLAWLRQILLHSLSRFIEQHMLASKRDMRKEVSLDRFRRFDESTSHFSLMLRARNKTPSALVQNRDDAVLLADLLAQLPEQYREVLVLRNMQGLSFEEVSTRMDRSLGATRMLWLRAIERMRTEYQKVVKDDEP